METARDFLGHLGFCGASPLRARCTIPMALCRGVPHSRLTTGRISDPLQTGRVRRKWCQPKSGRVRTAWATRRRYPDLAFRYDGRASFAAVAENAGMDESNGAFLS